MQNENIMWIKYLILELKQNKSSANPIKDNKLQINIIWDISLLPLIVTNIIFEIKTIKISIFVSISYKMLIKKIFL